MGQSVSSELCCAGERALETLREMDAAAVRCFRPAARKLLQELGDPEKALAMALARVTGFTAVKVGATAQSMKFFSLNWPVKCANACPGSAALQMVLQLLVFLHMNGSAVACVQRDPHGNALGLRILAACCDVRA